ncbi:MAG: hypothetical protein ACRD3V_34645 [Vicinamibacteria bacterium]
MRARAMVSLTLLASLSAGFGCDFNPTAPFEGFDNEGAGVVLSGRFADASSALALRAQSAAQDSLTVVVLDESGDEVGQVAVENGSFTLRGLPEGRFTVDFYQGSTKVGSLIFDEVLPNQQIAITVEMANGSIRLLDEKRTGIGHGDIELEGIARSIRVESDPMTGSLEVNGQLVRTRAAETAIRKGNDRLTLEDLSSGDRVHVKGEWETADDGTQYVFAREIKLQEEEDDDDEAGQECSNISGGKVGERIVLEGTVLSGNNQSFVMDVNGNRADRPVNVTFGGTPTCVGQAKNGPCQIGAGNKVNVKGTLAICDLVQADEVKIQK